MDSLIISFHEKHCADNYAGLLNNLLNLSNVVLIGCFFFLSPLSSIRPLFLLSTLPLYYLLPPSCRPSRTLRPSQGLEETELVLQRERAEWEVLSTAHSGGTAPEDSDDDDDDEVEDEEEGGLFHVNENCRIAVSLQEALEKHEQVLSTLVERCVQPVTASQCGGYAGILGDMTLPSISDLGGDLVPEYSFCLSLYRVCPQSVLSLCNAFPESFPNLF